VTVYREATHSVASAQWLAAVSRPAHHPQHCHQQRLHVSSYGRRALNLIVITVYHRVYTYEKSSIVLMNFYIIFSSCSNTSFCFLLFRCLAFKCVCCRFEVWKHFHFSAFDDDIDSVSKAYNSTPRNSNCYYLVDVVVCDTDSLQMSVEVRPNRLATRRSALCSGLFLISVTTTTQYDAKFPKTDCTKSTRSTLFVNPWVPSSAFLVTDISCTRRVHQKLFCRSTFLCVFSLVLVRRLYSQ